MNPVATPHPLDLFDAHERRRSVHVPTLTVLVGPGALAHPLVRRWSEARGRPLVVVDPGDRSTMTASWFERLSQLGILQRWLFTWLADQLGRSVELLEGQLRRMTWFERQLFLDRLPIEDDKADRRFAVQVVLEEATQQVSANPLGFLRGCADIRSFAPREHVPVWFVRGHSQSSIDPVTLVDELSAMVEADPGLSLCWSLASEDLKPLLEEGPKSRSRDLVRSGLVSIPGLSTAEIGQQLEHQLPQATTSLAGTIKRLSDDGASPELVDLLANAAKSGLDVSTDPAEATDRARSAAERFLFERLESLPETAGLFELNGSVSTSRGERSVFEVDLLARPVRLALEIDGYYHFQSPEAYRRDRRKDLALQEAGYLVIRVLAEDVVARLETILDTLLDAVARRRGTITLEESQSS